MRRPKLIPNWKRVAKWSLSFWLSILASVLSALQFALPFVAPQKPSLAFAGSACVVALSAAAVRLIYQRRLHDDVD